VIFAQAFKYFFLINFNTCITYFLVGTNNSFFKNEFFFILNERGQKI